MIASINRFKKAIKDMKVTEINIDTFTNPDLYPVYMHFKQTFANITNGIIIIDTQGIYTPIEEYDNTVIHLMRLPKSAVPVYALFDFRNIVCMNDGNILIIFQGIAQTSRGDYKFISNDFYIRPVPGVSLKPSLLTIHIIYKTRTDTVEDNNDDYENFDEVENYIEL